MDFVDASHGSELQKRGSITGCVFFIFSEGSITHKSATQTVTASGSTEAEFTAAFTAAKTALSEICPPGTWISTRRSNRNPH